MTGLTIKWCRRILHSLKTSSFRLRLSIASLSMPIDVNAARFKQTDEEKTGRNAVVESERTTAENVEVVAGHQNPFQTSRLVFEHHSDDTVVVAIGHQYPVDARPQNCKVGGNVEFGRSVTAFPAKRRKQTTGNVDLTDLETTSKVVWSFKL